LGTQDQWTPEWLRQQILQEDFRRRHMGGGAATKTAEGHMTPRADLLDEVKPPGKIKYVAAASGALLPVIGVGNAKVKGANGELVGLGNVLLVEEVGEEWEPEGLGGERGSEGDWELSYMLGDQVLQVPLQQHYRTSQDPTCTSVNMLRAFGCMVVFHVPKEKRGKLEASGRWGVHLGIAKDHKGWLLWDLTTQKLTVSRDVKFLESLYYKEWKQQQQKLPSTPLIVEADEVQQPSRQVEVAVSEEEMSGVTEEGGAAEVEQQQQQEQQQQHESPPRVPHPLERPRRDVRPPRKYCEGLAEKYGLQDGGKPATPLPSGFTVEPCADEEVVGDSDRKLFHSMVGSLNYAANHTRPDIAFATSRLASVVSRPSHEQLEAAKRLVRYVSATASVGLEYSGVRQRLQRGAADVKSGEMLLSCYTDASFNSVKADGTSIGGYVCLLGGGAVSWRSKKQNEGQRSKLRFL
ncbi:hypothetical protein CLOM_g14206, partial [Closterium sp. NIES-68]